MRVEHRGRHTRRALVAFAAGDRETHPSCLVDLAAQQIWIDDRRIGEFGQRRAQHLVEGVVVPGHQDPARRSDMQRNDLADMHLTANPVPRLGECDTHPEPSLATEEARRLTAGVAQRFQRRCHRVEQSHAAGDRRRPVGNPRTDPEPITHPIEELLGHQVGHQPLHRRRRVPGSGADFAERQLGLGQREGVHDAANLRQDQQRFHPRGQGPRRRQRWNLQALGLAHPSIVPVCPRRAAHLRTHGGGRPAATAWLV